MTKRVRIFAVVSSATLIAAAVLWFVIPNRGLRSVEAAAPRGSVEPRGSSSYMPVVEEVKFDDLYTRLSRDKGEVMRRQLELLRDRYDLSNKPVTGVTMFRGKPVQGGVRVKLPANVTWQDLAAMAPATIKQRKLWPKGFEPLPHPKQEEGGMVFPAFHIQEIKRQEGRDLSRFDVDFDIPEQFLPEFPPAIFLTTRPDLGDVSQGKLVTLANFNALFEDILNPK